MRTRSRSAENRRHHAIRQGRSEGRFTTQPVWKQREIAMLADSGWSETALES
jgi:hypothetical protein